MSCPINKLYNDFENLKNYLLENKELDYLNTVEKQFTKNLIISSASFLESYMQDILTNFVESTSNHQLITSFFKNKAISRQYHTYFDWNSKNANNFLGLFGIDFRDTTKAKIKEENTDKHIKDFLELGKIRNELVHQNFTLYTTDKTTKEIIELFDSAYKFLDFFKQELELSLKDNKTE